MCALRLPARRARTRTQDGKSDRDAGLIAHEQVQILESPLDTFPSGGMRRQGSPVLVRNSDPTAKPSWTVGWSLRGGLQIALPLPKIGLYWVKSDQDSARPHHFERPLAPGRLVTNNCRTSDGHWGFPDSVPS